ncbi:MAG: VOC family protein [Candidatus Krumholzibacteriota bacterium]|nr:VOC family protein [Candidatus Krumholzibacteriota bacterium]
MVRVDQIDHVELFVPNRREAAAWYARVLGCEVVPEFEHWSESPRGPLMVSPDGGNTKLALFRGEPQNARPTAGFHLVAFRVDGATFAEFVTHLAQLELTNDRGEPVTAESVADHGQALSIYFCDPFGHRFEITTYDYVLAKESVRKKRVR